jgi:hypothetical protein
MRGEMLGTKSGALWGCRDPQSKLNFPSLFCDTCLFESHVAMCVLRLRLPVPVCMFLFVLAKVSFGC